MVTARPVVQDHFSGLVAIISSATVASIAVFMLFNSFLENLAPPSEDKTLTVGFASFGTAIALLVLSLFIRRSLTSASIRLVGYTCAALLLTSVCLFVYFQSFTRAYVYRNPPAWQANDSQTRHVRGELHEKGIILVGDKTVAQAVFELGGPDYVNSKGLLWTEASRLQVLSRMEMIYIALTMLLTTTLFGGGLAVWRVSSPVRRSQSSRVTRTKPRDVQSDE